MGFLLGFGIQNTRQFRIDTIDDVAHAESLLSQHSSPAGSQESHGTVRVENG